MKRCWWRNGATLSTAHPDSLTEADYPAFYFFASWKEIGLYRCRALTRVLKDVLPVDIWLNIENRLYEIESTNTFYT